MNGKRNSKLLLILLAGLILAGCGDHQQRINNMRNYIKQVKSQPPPGIEPLPLFKEFEPFQYSAGDVRDPFMPVKAVVEGDSGLQPDKDRPKELLEGFPLDSLRMVGTLNRDDQLWALVSTSEGGVHRVHVGNHLGHNFGRIAKISHDKIDLVEMIPDGGDGWIERNVELTLSKP